MGLRATDARAAYEGDTRYEALRNRAFYDAGRRMPASKNAFPFVFARAFSYLCL